jgi:hypothetical protein
VAWAQVQGGLPWYQAYNATKHDRHDEFPQANFEHMIDAVCGLQVLLSAQFHCHDFAPGPGCLLLEGPDMGIGGYLAITFPTDWPTDDRYEFDWGQLCNTSDPFQIYPYPP